MQRRLFSTKKTLPAPRLIASMPKLPLPANNSKNEAPHIWLPKMENKASLTYWEVGRIFTPLGIFNTRPLNSPDITRMG